MTALRGERITVIEADLVVQPAPDEVARFAEPRFGELISPLPLSSRDRAIGRRRFEVVVGGWRFEVTTESAQRAELRDRALRAAAEHQIASEVVVRAQIPGRVVRVWVVEGQQVEQGERLLAIEAMKMENEIRAPHDGTVHSVRIKPGARVERNDDLLTVRQ